MVKESNHASSVIASCVSTTENSKLWEDRDAFLLGTLLVNVQETPMLKKIFTGEIEDAA